MKLRIAASSIAIIGSMFLLSACVPQVPTVPTTPTAPPTTPTTDAPAPTIQNGTAKISCGESTKGNPVVASKYFSVNTTKSGDIVLTLSKKPDSHSTFTSRNNGELFYKIQNAKIGDNTVIGNTSETDIWFTLFYKYKISNPDLNDIGANVTLSFVVKIENPKIIIESNFGAKYAASSDFSRSESVLISHTAYTGLYSNGKETNFLTVEKYIGSYTLTPDTFLTDPTFSRPSGWGYTEGQISASSNMTPPIQPSAFSASLFDWFEGDGNGTRFGCETSASLSY